MGKPFELCTTDWSIRPWEEFWVTHQPYLLQHGYKLPPRYDPNWIPSWETNKELDPNLCPDSHMMRPCNVLDAIRISDGTKVAVKLVRTDSDVPILEYLHSPTLLADPRNHTVPLLDKLVVPDREDEVFIIMPVLLLSHDICHPFKYISEVIELTKQFLEGLEFMHEHRIAHRDACTYNLMVDSTKLVPNGDFSFFHPELKEDWSGRVAAVERRSVAPLKYYFIDFETACWYPHDVKDPRCVGIFGQERGVPEMSETVPYDPFKLDVYQLGKAFQRLLDKHHGLEFLTPLCEAMTCADPDKRPTAAEAHQLFETIISSFTEADMSRQIWRRYISLGGGKPPKPYVPLSARLSSFFRLRNFTFLIKVKLMH